MKRWNVFAKLTTRLIPFVLAGLAPSCQALLEEEPFLPSDCTHALAAYEFGDSRKELAAFETRVRETTPGAPSSLERELVWILRAPEATFAGKQFACRMLRRVGTERSVPVLADMLRDPELAHPARFALQGIDSRKVDRALRDALEELDGDLRIGVIDTLAARGDGRAVADIAELIESDDEPTARAAITALGRIGGPRAAGVLADADVASSLHEHVLDARLQCADGFLDEGRELKALGIYRELTDDSHPAPCRVAAWRGVLRAEPDDAVETLVGLLDDDAPEVRAAAAGFVSELPADADPEPLARKLSTTDPETRVRVLAAFAARGESCAAPAALEALEAGSQDVRIAALRALAIVGTADHVERVAWFAGRTNPEGTAASATLRRLSGPGVEDELRRCLGIMNDPVRAALVETLVARRSPGVKDTVFELATADGARVRRAALGGIAELAGRDDLSALLALAGELETNRDRGLLAKSIRSVCEGADDREACLRTVVASLDGKPPTVRAALLRVLGSLPGEASLAPLLAAVKSGDVEERSAALASLAAWPDAAPLETLRDTWREAEDPEVRTAALQGYLRLVALAQVDDPAAIRSAFEEAFGETRAANEKFAVLAAASTTERVWAVGFLQDRRADADVGGDASVLLVLLCSKVARMVGHAAQGCAVTLAQAPSGRYDPGSPAALTDGKWGSTEHTDGTWHGFEGTDLDAVVDLGSVVDVESVRLGFLCNPDSWIFPPKRVEFSLSDDGESWRLPRTTEIEFPAKMVAASLMDTAADYTEKARYVRVVAKNAGILPDWHPGSGEKAWLFVDEIQVNPSYEE